MKNRHRANWPKQKPLEAHMPQESEAVEYAVKVLRDTHPDADPLAALFERATGGKSAEGLPWLDVSSEIALTYQIVMEESIILAELWEEHGKEEAIAFVEQLHAGSLHFEGK